MAREFNLVPRAVAPVNTKHRKINTEIPVKDSLPLLQDLRGAEPRFMTGQLPIIWESARNFNVFDAYGNKWLDFTSGVVAANSGHGNAEVIKAIQAQLDASLLHTFCFPNKARKELIMELAKIIPKPLSKAFLMSTGSEAADCAIKFSRTYGKTKRTDKIQIISFEDGFHGRTLGALLAGGNQTAKAWISHIDPDMIQVPFPNAFKYSWADEADPNYSDDACFETFIRILKERGGDPDRMCAIMGETFQGGWTQLMPKGFVQKLRAFADAHDILIVLDEIQAGFGRTGKLFGFEHYGIVPDIILLGKGFSGSLPIAAVVGRSDILDLYGPNELTSTHSGNPLTSAAATANIRYILSHDLARNASTLGEKVVAPKLKEMKSEFKEIGFVCGAGLAWGVVFVKPGTKEIDCDFAHDVVEKAFEKGLLFFAPVGSGSTIKISPPLTITEEAMLEGLAVLRECISEVSKA